MNSPIEPALLAPSLHEAARLDALHRLELLDTPPSEAFDRITRMAAQLFNLPIAAVSLTDSDRQWFKSKVGVEHDTIPRLRAPCAEVADTAHVLVVPDLLENASFRASKLAADGIRFYAGAPLVTSDGFALGAMCVLGTEPRQVTEAERHALQDLATMVMAQIELQHALGRIDPTSGLPNRNQFIVDFNDMELAEPAGDMRLAALVSLASPQELSDAQRVMGAGYLDEMVRDVVPQLRLAGAGKIYHVGSTQFAFFAPRGVTLETFRTQMQSWLDARASHGQARFITTTTVGIAPFTVGQTEGLDLLRNMHSAAHDGLAAERWGRSVFHCPYCHGYELDEGRIGVLASGPLSVHQAQMLPHWGQVTLFTNGVCPLDEAQRADLAERGVQVDETPVRPRERSGPGPRRARPGCRPGPEPRPSGRPRRRPRGTSACRRRVRSRRGRSR